MKRYHQSAFTLIELLVVIVIIGILAGISVALFGDFNRDARVAKYRSERSQYAREATSNCIADEVIGTCPYGSLYYQNASDSSTMYKKSIVDDIAGSQLTTDSILDLAVSPNGQEIVYANSSQSNYLYKKNNDELDNGTAITSQGAKIVDISPDGSLIVYTTDSDTVYVKNYDDTDNGTQLSGLTSVYSVEFSPDGTRIYYSDSTSTIKSVDLNGGDMQTHVTGYLVRGDFSIAPDGNSIVFHTLNDAYSQTLPQGTPTQIIEYATSGSRRIMGVEHSFDGTSVYVVADPSLTGYDIYKKSLNDATLGIGETITASDRLTRIPMFHSAVHLYP